MEFSQNGFNFKQVARDGVVAVYEKTKPSMRFPSFEVVKIGMSREREAFGVKFEAGETYPSNESWGDRGWTCQTKESAFKKMDEWVEAERLKVYLKKELEMRKAASL